MADPLTLTAEAAAALRAVLEAHPGKVVRLQDDGCSCGGKQLGLVLSEASPRDVVWHDRGVPVHLYRFDAARVPGARVEWIGGPDGFLSARPIRPRGDPAT